MDESRLKKNHQKSTKYMPSNRFTNQWALGSSLLLPVDSSRAQAQIPASERAWMGMIVQKKGVQGHRIILQHAFLYYIILLSWKMLEVFQGKPVPYSKHVYTILQSNRSQSSQTFSNHVQLISKRLNWNPYINHHKPPKKVKQSKT